MAKDGVTIDLIDGRATISGQVPAEMVYVDGHTVGQVTESTLKDRRRLREGGVVTVLALVDETTNRLAEPPEFLTRGFVHDDHTFDGAVAEVEKALARVAEQAGTDLGATEDAIRRAVNRYLERRYRRAPMVIAIVVDA